MVHHDIQAAFAAPQKSRDRLLAAGILKGHADNFLGKSFICVSLTRFCSVGCDFCFFKSGNPFKEPTTQDRFSLEGQNRFVRFANQVNLGYLLISGGGEPMMEKSAILKIIREVSSDRIVLVTSGNWAKNKSLAEHYLAQISQALALRTSKTELTVRLSFDQGHARTLGFDPAKNLIDLFKKKYHQVPGLDLQLHTFIGDSTLEQLLDELRALYQIAVSPVSSGRIVDGSSALKVVPRQAIVSFDDYTVKVGYAKLFQSNLLVDLKEPAALQSRLKIFEEDLCKSEEGNPSVVKNVRGEKGFDFWVNYNGNVTTWGNQYNDNLMNIYTDEPEEVIEKSLSDPAALAFLENGAAYRDRIVSEVNKIAVLRGKAVNIRDYTSALMFDEARTRLYYTLRVLQDQMGAGVISSSALLSLDPDLQRLIHASSEQLKEAYWRAEHTIVEQTMERSFDQDQVLDILAWIKLGHYQLSEEKIARLLNYYNANVAKAAQISALSLIPIERDALQFVRMTEFLTHIKSEALAASDEAQVLEAQTMVC